MMRKIVLLSTLAVLSAGLLPVGAAAQQGASAGDLAYFLQVKKAVEDGNKKWLASQINYPLKVVIGGKLMQVDKPDQFIANYDKIMTPRVVEGIRKEDGKGLMPVSTEVMAGGGVLWIMEYYPDYPKSQKSAYVISQINGESREEFEKRMATKPQAGSAPSSAPAAP